MKKTALLILFLLCALLLTGCYREMDPWPASAGYAPAQVTLAPHITATPEPLPVVTSAPTDAPVVDLWDDGPTVVPGGSIEPGFNG